MDEVEHYEACAKLEDENEDCDCGAETAHHYAVYNREHDRYAER